MVEVWVTWTTVGPVVVGLETIAEEREGGIDRGGGGDDDGRLLLGNGHGGGRSRFGSTAVNERGEPAENATAITLSPRGRQRVGRGGDRGVTTAGDGRLLPSVKVTKGAFRQLGFHPGTDEEEGGEKEERGANEFHGGGGFGIRASKRRGMRG